MSERRRPPRWSQQRVLQAVAHSEAASTSLDDEAGGLAPDTMQEIAANLLDRAHTGINKNISRRLPLQSEDFQWTKPGLPGPYIPVKGK